MNEAKIENIRNIIDNHSEVVRNIVHQVTRKYSCELDDLVGRVKHKLTNAILLTDEELERLALVLPATLYFAGTGLEVLGVDSDSSKAIKAELFNVAYMQATGTIQDKNKTAELNTQYEQILEVAYTRSYKMLKQKIEHAVLLSGSVKRLLDCRISEAYNQRMTK